MDIRVTMVLEWADNRMVAWSQDTPHYGDNCVTRRRVSIVTMARECCGETLDKKHLRSLQCSAGFMIPTVAHVMDTM